MSTSEAERLRDLVALCLDRIERDGADAVESVCRDHPEQASAIRERLEFLARSGLLERPRAADPAALPEKLGDFRLLRKLGEGGMGVVYLARQESLGREVALKLVRPDQLWFSGARERFRREVDAIARLQHPGVVPIHAVGEEAGIPFFAMENVAGATLADVIAALAGETVAQLEGRDLARAIATRADALAGGAGSGDARDVRDPTSAFVFDGSWTEACFRIVRQAAEALDHVHRRGVLHRDLKPSNVMVTRAGRAMVLDFGLASTSGASRLTRSGTRLGSLPYLAPEQWSGKADRVDARTDIYALGVTLYELLTLRVPYSESSAEALMRTIEIGRPESVRAQNRSVPWDAETVCLTAMEREPARRYASAADFARDLENVLHHRPIEARRAGATLRARRWAQRHPALGVGIVLGSLLVIGGPMTFGWVERASRLRLDKAYQRADGLRLSGQSTALIATDPGLALLVAIEGARRQPGSAANDALFAALAACREEHTLTGHGNLVEQVRFSPDGTKLATASADGSACVWDARSGRELHALVGHGGGVRTVAFSPDGSELLTASSDGEARVWDVASGATRHVLRGPRDEPNGPLNGARYDGAGAHVVTFGGDAAVRLFDACDGRWLRTLAERGGEVADVSFSQDGRSLVTASADGKARLFDVASGACLRRFDFGSGVHGARLSPGGERLALCGRGNFARLFDVASGREVVPPLQHADLVSNVDWSPDGARLLTASWDHTVGIWDANSGERLATLRGPRRILRFARFSPDGTLVLGGGDDATAYLWSSTSGRVAAVLRGHAGSIGFGGFSGDGRHVATSGDDVKVWSVPESARRLEWEGHGDKVQSIAVSADGRRFVTASRDGTARVWDVETRRLELTLFGHAGHVNTAAFSPDGRHVVTGSDDTTARVWDACTGALLAVLHGHRDLMGWTTFDPSGERVLTANHDGTSRVFAWRTGRELVALSTGRGAAIRAEFSADGARIVTVTKEGAATVWDATTGARVAQFADAGGAVRTPRFTPDGRHVLVALTDRSVAVWDTQTNQSTPLLKPHGTKLQSLSVSPDGRRIATSSDDSAVRLWDAVSGELLATLVGHEELVPWTAFTADGATLVTASIDGDVRRRPVDPMAAALRVKPRELTADEHVAFEVGDVAAWREANELVRTLAERSAVAADLLESIRRADVRDEVRDAALAVAADVRDHPLQLARASAATVRAAGRDPADYRLALRRAEAAGRMAPDGNGAAACQLLAIVAMAHARLGEADAARAALATLRARAAELALVSPAVPPLLREATALVEGGAPRSAVPTGH